MLAKPLTGFKGIRRFWLKLLKNRVVSWLAESAITSVLDSISCVFKVSFAIWHVLQKTEEIERVKKLDTNQLNRADAITPIITMQIAGFCILFVTEGVYVIGCAAVTSHLVGGTSV